MRRGHKLAARGFIKLKIDHGKWKIKERESVPCKIDFHAFSINIIDLMEAFGYNRFNQKMRIIS